MKEWIIIKELELKQFLKLFWDRKILIIVIMVLFGVLGGVKIKYFTTPVYQASGKLICAKSEEDEKMVTSTELSMPSSLAETYANLIKSDLIVNQVIQNLGLNMSTAQLRNAIELTPVTKVYYQVSARSTDRVKAAEIANEFIKVFSEEVQKFYAIDSIHTVDQAQIPEGAINMDMTKNIKIFAGIGFVVAAGIVIIMFIFNNTVTNSEQIKRYTKLTTLASIPRYSGSGDLITLKDSKSPYAESIKILRTNLQYMYDKGTLQTVAITSSLPGEGKSWLSANLAIAFANSGKKTLIIDADMRRGRQHKLFKVRKMPGLSEFLRSTTGITDLVVTKKGRKGKVKTQALKMETESEELEVEVEPEKKTRRKSTQKEDVIEETKKTSTRKTTKKAEEKAVEPVSRKKGVAKKSEEEEPSIFEFINETSVENLYVISSGSERMESSELLSTTKLEDALEELKEEYDMIIIDTPPVSVVADGFIISRMVDTNMIVLKHGNTEISELNKIKNNIQEIGGEVIGTVINKIPDANKKYYNTYYNKRVK